MKTLVPLLDLGVLLVESVRLGGSTVKSCLFLMFKTLIAACLFSSFLVLGIVASAPNGVLRGIVTDALGHPIGNAAVVVHSSTTVRIAKSRSDGTFTLASLPEGRYRADVIANGFMDQYIEPITIPAQEDRPVTVTLKIAPPLYECGRNRPSYTEVSNGRELVGQVRHDRSPVVGAKVVLVQEADLHLVASQKTDKDGDFQFRDLAPGKYMLKVAQKPFKTYRSEALWVAPEALTNLNIGMNRKGGVVICQ